MHVSEVLVTKIRDCLARQIIVTNLQGRFSAIVLGKLYATKCIGVTFDG
jgi:hypothetical protein